MTPEQERKLNEVYDFITKLKAASTIPFEVDKAFRKRLGIGGDELAVSATSLDAHDKAVNESGSSSYQVLDDPELFLQVTIDEVTYDIPAFTQ